MTKGYFDSCSTLSVSILEETRKQLPSKKQKRVDWMLFNKWEREAEQQKQKRNSATEPAALNAVQTTKQNPEEEDMDMACASHCPPPYRLLSDQSVQAAATEEAKVPSAPINDKEKIKPDDSDTETDEPLALLQEEVKKKKKVSNCKRIFKETFAETGQLYLQQQAGFEMD